MVEMKLKCNCCGCIATNENLESFKRIFISPIKHIPTEDYSNVIARDEKPEHIDVCGHCYDVLNKAFKNESIRQKGEV